ncbi:MAG: sigma-54 dependent transcriptional regulator [Herminiimonas sp.]|uniref:sigma-54-dependent transcriptional regulator n=1 Tax=Herminiimonas sp. TaxID=1926289 RepID=UPI00271F7D99|nr:sigma-54 dependent transcriptional regulator [Herminiimonas sp.]MDO9422461.1 sigma-54 dependent transcriptional regulator [Herminiimonas sp.]
MTTVPQINTTNDEPFLEAFGGWQERTILIVDDEPGMRSFLYRTLVSRCSRVESVESVEEASVILGLRHFDLIILDNSLPGKAGVDWLQEIRELGLHNDVVLITAFADLEIAIRALRAGASDFLLKPFRVNQILSAIGRCFDRAQLRRENFVLRRELDSHVALGVDGLIGQSNALQPIREAITRLALVPSTVLITGESGTGKEIAARAMHYLSNRSGNHFVPINCGAVAPEIIESELFGHIKGAFSGAASSREGLFFYAQGGTLFLDEVAELPLALQVKLLRVLEERKIRPVGAEREIPVDVRVIAATNRNVEDAVRDGRFREDLYYRLNVVQLHMPPLRERMDDIPALASYFSRQLSQQLGVPAREPDNTLLASMSSYAWPGNVRELRNAIERWLILGSIPDAASGGRYSKAEVGKSIDESLEAVEKRHMLKVLSEAGGSKTEAARRLGVSRKTLERKCAEWNV